LKRHDYFIIANFSSLFSHSFCTGSHRKRYRSEDRQREPIAIALPLLREIWNAFVLQSQAIDAHQRRVLALPEP
jgi:hypothetical protein